MVLEPHLQRGRTKFDARALVDRDTEALSVTVLHDRGLLRAVDALINSQVLEWPCAKTWAAAGSLGAVIVVDGLGQIASSVLHILRQRGRDLDALVQFSLG